MQLIGRTAAALQVAAYYLRTRIVQLSPGHGTNIHTQVDDLDLLYKGKVFQAIAILVNCSLTKLLKSMLLEVGWNGFASGSIFLLG